MHIARAAAVVGITFTATIAGAGAASAHVTIPEPGEQGGFSIVTFSVPNERDDADTTILEVQLPQDHPLAFVSAQPKPGWTIATTTRTLDEPIDAFGEEVTEVVDTVTWTGGAIEPGQFDTFSLSVGTLPDGVDELAFPAIQTYSSGEEVAWIEPIPAGGEEPDHPAPVLALTAPEGGGGDTETSEPVDTDATVDGEQAAAAASDDGTDGIAVAALVVGIVAALLAGAALATARRRTT